METYRINELDFFLPSGWQDNSMHMFVFRGDTAEGEAALAITRDVTQAHVAIHQYADQQLVEAARKFPQYSVIDRRTIVVEDEPAIETLCSWLVPGQAPVYQRQLILQRNGSFLTFTLSSKAPDLPQAVGLWKTILRSIRRRGAA